MQGIIKTGERLFEEAGVKTLEAGLIHSAQFKWDSPAK